MARPVAAFAAATLLTVSCGDSSNRCEEGACHYDYQGECKAYVGEDSLPHCSRSGGEWLEACPSDGLVASCLTTGTAAWCPGHTQGTYYYANYKYNLAYPQAMCSAQWTSY